MWPYVPYVVQFYKLLNLSRYQPKGNKFSKFNKKQL
ncbi:MAG: hypothetical protein RI894_2315 [Bacteroidota bacterium]|jgi:hypothetical protein